MHTLRAIAAPEDIVVGDLVLLELLQGARDERHAARMERSLHEFIVSPMLSPELAAIAAGNYRRLRDQGVTVSRTADLIIATFCIERGHVLLHDDQHFEPMRALGLQTFA